MAGRQGVNVESMADGLGQVLQDIATTMTAPDADVPFLMKLQGVILSRLKHQGPPPGPPGGAGGPPPGAPQGAPTPPGGPGGPPPQGAEQGPPPGGGGAPAGIPQPNPDELRRMIAERTGR